MMGTSFPLVLIVILAQFTPGSSSPALISFPNLKIIGGENATEGEFPFMTSLQMKPPFGKQYHFCSASILNSTHVVTTASCVSNRLKSQIIVIAGAHNLLETTDDPAVQIRSVDIITPHPLNYPDRLLYDMALLTLNDSLSFTPRIQPMPLSLSPSFTGNCTLPGWGFSYEHHPHQLLQKVNMTLISLSTCSSIYQNILELDPNSMLCSVGQSGVGPCSGDLGSPLLCQTSEEGSSSSSISGLVSWSMVPCGNSGYPTIFTNISSLTSFSFKF